MNNSLLFRDLYNISFIGINDTVLDCGGTAGFQFINVTNLSMKNMKFTNCSKNYTITINYRGVKNYTSMSGLNILNCTNLQFYKVTINNSRGMGLSIFNTNGIVTFYQCDFNFNGNDEVQGGLGILIELSRYHNMFQNIVNSSYNLTSCTFISNFAYEKDIKHTPFGRGGAIRIYIRDASRNNIIVVAGCSFYNNTASRWGGAFFASIHDSASNNRIILRNSTFIHNFSPSGNGGASYMGFQCGKTQKICLDNTYLLHSCLFQNNTAKYGGGSVFTSTRIYNSKVSTRFYNNVTHYNCTWANNSAHYGSAVAIIPDTWSLLAMGAFPSPVFEDCIISSNYVMEREVGGSRLREPYQQSTMGVGALYCTLYNKQFSGKLLMESNNGSAILGSSCSLTFQRHSIINFYKNSGYLGGALHLLGYSTIYIKEHVSLTFSKNTAETNGGAIYYQSSDIIEHAYSYNCFISKTENSNNTTFLFSGNQAGIGNDAIGHGDSIYITSLLPCMREYNDSATTQSYSFLNKIAHFIFTNESDNEVSTEVSKFTTKLLNQSQQYIPIIPGKYSRLKFDGIDDLGNTRPAVYMVTVRNDANSTVKSHYQYSYITNKTIKLLGIPGDRATVTLSTISQHKTVLSVRVELQPCPPGYILLNDKDGFKTCVCSADTATPYIGIQSCDVFKFQAHNNRGYWFGYTENATVYEFTFITGYCPKGFCFYSSNKLPPIASKTLLNDIVCVSTRTGKLCSQCKDNKSVYYHSPSFKCGDQDLCHFGWLFYIISDIVPVTILFIVIISLNIPFTSGSMNGFIFYAQVIGFFQVTAHDRIKFHKGTNTFLSINNMLHEIFNLQFFNHDKLSFCLLKKANNLDMMVIQYITFFYSFCLLLSIIMTFNVCNIRRVKAFFGCRVYSIQSSMIHGMSAFLVLCYAQCAKVSISMFSYGRIVGKKGEVFENVVYLYAHLSWLSPSHLKYLIPSVFIALVVVIIPLLALLAYPKCYKCLAVMKIRDTKCVHIFCRLLQIEKLKPFLDSFQGCYKDDYRFFSGLYFLYRILILLNMSLNYLDYSFITLEAQLVLMLLLHAIVQPYKKKKHNITDALLFANMLLINGISMYNFTNARSPHGTPQQANTIILIQVLLMMLPFMCVISYCGYYAAKTVILSFSKSRSDETIPNSSLLDYCELPTSRSEHEDEIITSSAKSYDTFEY